MTTAAILLFAASVGSFWQIRPQIASFGFFAALILILDWVFNSWDQQWHLTRFKDKARFDRYRTSRIDQRQLRWLWLCVPLFAFWANSHGGFVAGYCLFAAYLVVRGYELWVQRKSQAWGPLGTLAIVGIMSGMATFATPVSYTHLTLPTICSV